VPLSTEQPAPRNKVSRPSRKARRKWPSGVVGIRLLIAITSVVKIEGMVGSIASVLVALERGQFRTHIGG
jgi:hypothetical protein